MVCEYFNDYSNFFFHLLAIAIGAEEDNSWVEADFDLVDH